MNEQLLSGWVRRACRPNPLKDCVLIVPTYQRPREMVRLLNVLLSLPDVPGTVLVVDGSPGPEVDNELQAWARRNQLPFDFYRVTSPRGLTRQRNVGLDATNQPYVFFLDDDCLPEPGYFRFIHAIFVGDREKKIGAVRGFMTNGINKPVTRLWKLRFALGIVPRGQPGQYFPCGSSATWDMVPPFKGTRPVETLPGCACAFRREVFDKNRFSEFFYGYAQGEDLEMSLRVGRDWSMVVSGDAMVNHDHAEGGRPAGYPRGKMVVRNKYFIWKRHSPHCGFLDRARFWTDHLLVISFNLIGFIVRPWRRYNLDYAFGTIAGVMGCLFNPPKYEEPPAKRVFKVQWKDLDEITSKPN